MNWKEHLVYKTRKAQNAMWACRRACGVKWGLGPSLVHWLYITIIRPSVTMHPWYGGLVVRLPLESGN